MIVVPIVRDNAVCWSLLPELEQRVKAFSADFEPDMNSDKFWEDILQCFVQRDPHYTLFAVLDDGNVVAHCLLALNDFYGARSLDIMQYECDNAISREVAKEYLGHFESFAKWLGAKSVRCLADSPDGSGRSRHVRAYRALYGFKEFRSLMRREVA